ncbi:glycosyltransferase family A protein [Edaphocola aurantiacus]|uniref:glycosyltransferase family A protein n=1 Tax=Edaphocola aurantiacus TaxID=2601682 RepID=UPI001C948DD7|nr:glycosyltransferase family A protein [Edaphocola aurantiacus]
MEKTLTIFTPAFNRAHTLPRLYESLLRQTSTDFEWLIVNDGSSDDTEVLVQKWISEALIPIRYVHQQNQGMHGAHNTAYKNIATELNVCIDSDDYMPDNAVEIIVHFWKQHGNEKYAGLIGLDQIMGGGLIGAAFPEDLKETTLLGYYEGGGSGDKKLVYRTEIINRYPEYPIFSGEKYVGLAYKYYLVDQDMPLLVCNEVLCIVEYQQDGSSFSMFRQYWNNPKGFAFYRKERMKVVSSAKRRFIENIHYVSSALMAGEKQFITQSPFPAYTILALPFGWLLKQYIGYKVRKGAKMNFNKTGS